LSKFRAVTEQRPNEAAIYRNPVASDDCGVTAVYTWMVPFRDRVNKDLLSCAHDLRSRCRKASQLS